jgi:hypothetical protein
MSLQANRLDGPAVGEPPYLKIDADDVDYNSDTASEDDKDGEDSPPMSDASLGRGRGRFRGSKTYFPRVQSRRPKKGGSYVNGRTAIIEIASSTRSYTKCYG